MQHRVLIAQQVSILLAARGAHKMEAGIVGWVSREISDSAGRSTLLPLTLPFPSAWNVDAMAGGPAVILEPWATSRMEVPDFTETCCISPSCLSLNFYVREKKNPSFV